MLKLIHNYAITKIPRIWGIVLQGHNYPKMFIASMHESFQS